MRFVRTHYLVLGAIGGFIATYIDKVFKQEVGNLPMGSFIFVGIAIFIFIEEYLEKRNGEEK